MPHPLDPIFNPRVLAVIGASNDPEKRGYRAIKTLFADQYQGKIVPINPKATEILGLKCYRTLEEVPDEIDLALVCTAAKTVPDVVLSCGRKGVKGALLLAGGFSEASEEGRVLEQKTVAIAREYGVRLIGPNTNGICDRMVRLAAGAARDDRQLRKCHVVPRYRSADPSPFRLQHAAAAGQPGRYPVS
jgi:acetyltransferase